MYDYDVKDFPPLLDSQFELQTMFPLCFRQLVTAAFLCMFGNMIP